MHIKEQWSRLDPTTQQWLMDNPGCVVLPRTLTAIFNKETSQQADTDAHGESVLTDEDRQFIQAKAREALGAGTPWDYRFFDAVQPEPPRPGVDAAAEARPGPTDQQSSAPAAIVPPAGPDSRTQHPGQAPSGQRRAAPRDPGTESSDDR